MYSSATGPVRSRVFKWNRKRLADYERQCLGFGASLFCSDQDRVRLLHGEARPNAFVVPNAYADPSFAAYDFGDGFPTRNTLLYVGALNYEPNAQGLSWFIESIWPSFAAANPEARLLVVGRRPSLEVQRLCASRGDIELHSDVPDIKPYYRQARAAVVPVLAGGGTRIKILEAALAHRPVLSTSPGAAGLDFVPERDLLLFDDAAQLRAQYATLMRRDRYQALVRNARDLVMLRYSAQAFDDALAAAVSMLDGTTQPAPQAP
jgi:glycosyltransferase involved in cell wall biosynthesis